MVMVIANLFTGHPQDCGVISNRAMLFMMAPVGTECSMVEPYPFYGGNEAELIACADAFTWSDLSASLDGQPIAVTDQYIVRSPMYRLRWGPDNGFGLPPGATWSVAKAPFLMFAPLSPGKHEIEVHGVLHGPEGLTFGGDGTLIFTVK
jgi:hypothetical protein